MRRVWSLLVAVVPVACGAPADSPTSGAQAVMGQVEVHPAVQLTEAQQEGMLIFESLCWTCHGSAGRGDGPAVQSGSVPAPPSFHQPQYATATGEQLARLFTPTVAGEDPDHPHMQYVASLLRPERFDAALSFVPAIAYPSEIPGSAIAGRRIYEFRCVGCHGPEGRGDGPAAASLTMMRPADFTADTLIARSNWDALYRRIREGGRQVHGSSMPPWAVVFSDAETWDLVAYIATFQDVLQPPHWMP